MKLTYFITVLLMGVIFITSLQAQGIVGQLEELFDNLDSTPYEQPPPRDCPAELDAAYRKADADHQTEDDRIFDVWHAEMLALTNAHKKAIDRNFEEEENQAQRIRAQLKQELENIKQVYLNGTIDSEELARKQQEYTSKATQSLERNRTEHERERRRIDDAYDRGMTKATKKKPTPTRLTTPPETQRNAMPGRNMKPAFATPNKRSPPTEKELT